MTKSQIATLGKLSAECPHCNQVGALSKFATFYGERSGMVMVECQCGCGGKCRQQRRPVARRTECKCGCGGKWRRVEVGK